MTQKSIRIFLFFVLFLLMTVLTGCAGKVKNMSPVSPDEVKTRPDAGKSLVIFMRPSTLGFAIQSSVFEVKGEDVILTGIVAAKKKVAYEVEPGEHLFMVVGESADFMSANLEENKVYYALVTPRMGMWKARFSLQPVHSNELSSSQFEEWFNDCEWVKNSADSEEWARSNLNSIQQKRKAYYEKWIGKEPGDKPCLLSEDGR